MHISSYTGLEIKREGVGCRCGIGLTGPGTPLILCMESVFAALTGALFLHEAMTVREYIGSLIMLAAIVISQLPSKNKKEEVKEQ